jgi:type IV secretion system coupling TraD/TrwB family protein
MRPTPIGQDANGRPIYITPEMRKNTHLHVIGGSGTGKSKFLEWVIRKDIRAGQGFCLIDWHGTLYQDVVNYCARLDVSLNNDFRSVILLNPSQPDFVTGFNPFMNQGDDIATQVANRIAATIRPWGITDTNEMPTFEKVLRLLYTFAVQQRETLPNTALLLDEEREQLRDYAIEIIGDTYIKSQWRKLDRMNTRDRDQTVLSTENRLSRFLSSKTVKRFFGLKDHNINLREIMDKQQILLVNLGPSGYLDRESARVFASLLLNEFFETAMIRAGEAKAQGEEPRTFVLYLDEFQEYITEDIAAMLDQVRKGGLHMVLAHQHLGHLADNPKLRKSIFTNARIRAVFGGLDYEDASVMANEMFLPDLNTRQIKKAYYHTIHLYREESRTSKFHSATHTTSKGDSRTAGSGSSSMIGSGSVVSAGKTLPGSEMTIFTPFTEGWFSESESRSVTSAATKSDSISEAESNSEAWGDSAGETEFPVWVPIPIQELANESEWSREEKVSKVAEILKCQQQRHCFIKLDTEETQPLKVPFVKDHFQAQEYLLKYEQAVYDAQGALPGKTVDHLITQSEEKFLAAAVQSLKLASPIDIKGTEVRETTTEIPKPKKKRATATNKKAPANLFDTIKTEDE